MSDLKLDTREDAGGEKKPQMTKRKREREKAISESTKKLLSAPAFKAERTDNYRAVKYRSAWRKKKAYRPLSQHAITSQSPTELKMPVE